MASLTGQTISSTYDSLLKATDNGPITSSLKIITDGLGNSSSLELSTIAARITGTLSVTSSVSATSFVLGNGQYLRGTRTSGGLVINLLGIESGTDRTLMTITGDYVLQNGSSTALLTMTSAGAASFSNTLYVGGSSNGRIGVRGTTNDSSAYAFEAANSSGGTLFIVRNDGISTVAGSLGVGTFSPTSKLQVVGLPSYADNSAALSGGLTVGAFYHTSGALKVVI